MYICGVLSPKNYTIYTRVDASEASAFQARALSGSEGWAGAVWGIEGLWIEV